MDTLGDSPNNAEDGSFVRDAELWVESMGGTHPVRACFLVCMRDD